MPSTNPNPYAQIDSVLRKVARELPRLPDWWPEFLELSPASPDDERLAVYQAVRDDGTFQEHQGNFLVCYCVDQMLTRSGAVEPEPVADRIERIDELYKLLDPDRKPLSESNPLEGQPLGVWQSLFLEQLEIHGEVELVELFRRSPVNLITPAKFGQIPFFGTPADNASALRALVQTLYDEVSECVTSDWPMGKLRLRWDTRMDPILSVTISPTPIELVGGPRDGNLVDPALSHVDLMQLQGLFEEVRDFEWAVEFEERRTQSLTLWGSYGGCPIVMFTFYAGAQEGDRPTLKDFQRKQPLFPEDDEPDDE
jgi:hypothetical protein